MQPELPTPNDATALAALHTEAEALLSRQQWQAADAVYQQILSCSPQDAVALSSGEAEFYGIVEGATQGIGMRSLLADSSAAVGIVHRRGAGRVRHLEVRDMWVQDKVAKGEFSVHKVKGRDNVADILTKYVDKTSLDATLQ